MIGRETEFLATDEFQVQAKSLCSTFHFPCTEGA